MSDARKEYEDECAELEGLTPEEAEIKFLKEWGLA